MSSVKKQTLVGIGTALLAVISQISIPLPIGIPLTFQVFGIILISILFQAKLATITTIVYILIGTIGIPIFANFSGGFHCIIGPSGGFLLGFIVMAFIVGLVSQQNKAWLLWIGSYLGLLVDYILGVIWLMVVAHINFQEALISGVYPFIFKDLIVVALAICSAKYILKIERNKKI